MGLTREGVNLARSAPWAQISWVCRLWHTTSSTRSDFVVLMQRNQCNHSRSSMPPELVTAVHDGAHSGEHRKTRQLIDTSHHKVEEGMQKQHCCQAGSE